MALGNEVPATSVEKALLDAETGVPDEKAYAVGDHGVYESFETVFTATKLRKIDEWDLTGIDQDFVYFDDKDIEANSVIHYKMAKSQTPTPPPVPSPAISPTPAPPPASPTPAPTPKPTLLSRLFSKVKATFAKITIQASTALGEPVPLTRRKMSPSDKIILDDLKLAMKAPKDDGPTLVSERYFGLQVTSHSYSTANGPVNSTHIVFNQIDTLSDGTSTQYHWVYEISIEVPKLFAEMSKCASAIAVINNAQIPYKECQTLDTFNSGTKSQ
jgi:hypothetical protein